jgi:hypothetical protein
MTRAQLGVFSLSASSPDGDDSRYLRWHLLDHLPQQYEIPGMMLGQRFVSTPACRALRQAESDRFEPVNHFVYYLFEEPVAPAVDAFFALRDHLIEIGRFPERLPNRLVYGGEPVETHAAASAAVTAEVVPFRPNRGAYLLIEQGGDEPARWPRDQVDALLDVDGVAGMWSFTPTSLRPDEFSKSGYRVAIVYLDDDPAIVAKPINSIVKERWGKAGITPAFAAPFEAARAWEWHLHARPG